MNIKNIVTALIIASFLNSCTPKDINITVTKTASPTYEYIPPTFTSVPINSPSPNPPENPYPPCEQTYEYTPRGATRLLQLKLPHGLTLIEYDYWHDITEEYSGCLLANRRNRAYLTDINLSDSIQVTRRQKSNIKEEVIVLDKGIEVFKTEVSTYTYSGLLEAWKYDNHWVIEYVTTNAFTQDKKQVPPSGDIIDIVVDGISLKANNQYKSVFAFQLLDEKPFYFFKKQDDTYGINFDNKEVLLFYDKIPYDNPHVGFDVTILSYQNMVMFRALKDGTWVSVVIGAFNK